MSAKHSSNGENFVTASEMRKDLCKHFAEKKKKVYLFIQSWFFKRSQFFLKKQVCCFPTAPLVSPSGRWGQTLCPIDAQTAILIGGQGARLQFCKDPMWKLCTGQLVCFALQ